MSLGAPELALGRLGGVPSERASHLEAPREGLGTHFGDPMECAYSQNAHICEVFDDFGNRRFFRVRLQGGGGNEVFGGVFCVRWGPWDPPGECTNFLLGSRGDLWSGQSSNHDEF